MSGDGVVSAVRRGPGPAWVKRAARLGLVARGLVYGVVALIAFQIAWSQGAADDEASKEGAVEAIARQPLGRGLLLVLAAGFAGYVVWRGSEALWGRSDQDEDEAAKATAKRAASGAKAVVYLVLLVSTLRVVASGPDGRSGDDEPRSLTARAFELPAGQLLVGAVGVVLLGVAAYLAYRGVAQRFEDRLDTAEMGPVEGRVVDVVGTLGMAARGFVVGVIGFLVLKAALDYDADEAVGVDGTLRLLARQPAGQALLTVTAAGILAFGVYSFFEARHRDL